MKCCRRGACARASPAGSGAGLERSGLPGHTVLTSRPPERPMFELASTPQDLGEIVVQGMALGRLAFRRLFMLSSLMALAYILRTACLVWNAGDTAVDPAFMMGALLSPKCIAIAL